MNEPEAPAREKAVRENRINEGRPPWGRFTLSLCQLVPLAALLTGGCDWQLPGKPNPNERLVPPEYVLEFDALFKRNCAGCHGAEGKLGPAPPLNDPLFRAAVSEPDLKKVISEGRRSGAGGKKAPRTPMPAFARENGGSLSPQQIQALVYGIKGIRYRVVKGKDERSNTVERSEEGGPPIWDKPPKWPDDAPPYALAKPPAGATVAGNSKRGKKVFSQACAMCHGDRGEGVEKDGQRINKINDPAFLALISNQALRRIAITGRPDLGMPSYKDTDERGGYKLSKEDITDVVAFLASWR